MPPSDASLTAILSSVSVWRGGLAQDTLSIERNFALTIISPNTHFKPVEFLKFLPTTTVEVPPLGYP